jgi:hypothetical protein
MFLYDKRVWEVKPDAYSGEVFRVFAGDLSRRPRILPNDEEVSTSDEPLVIEVPVEHRPEFERDILNALRDVAGVSTTAIHPFLTNRDAVAACFTDRPSILSDDVTDLSKGSLRVYPGRLHMPELVRFAHLDLSLTGDATGVVVGCVDRFVEVDREGEVEVLPHIRVDLVLSIRPPPDGEVPYERIRALLYKLRELGLALRFVTADSFQSRDMLQTLRLKRFTTGLVSMDRTPLAYELLKAALYDRRVDVPENETLLGELLSLEVDAKTEKIDHRPGGSKDLADALAGVVHGLTMRREVWWQHRVNPNQAAPHLVRRARILQETSKTAAIDVDRAMAPDLACN